jgi:hypothetical protein
VRSFVNSGLGHALVQFFILAALVQLLFGDAVVMISVIRGLGWSNILDGLLIAVNGVFTFTNLFLTLQLANGNLSGLAGWWRWQNAWPAVKIAVPSLPSQADTIVMPVFTHIDELVAA